LADDATNDAMTTSGVCPAATFECLLLDDAMLQTTSMDHPSHCGVLVQSTRPGPRCGASWMLAIMIRNRRMAEFEMVSGGNVTLVTKRCRSYLALPCPSKKLLDTGADCSNCHWSILASGTGRSAADRRQSRQLTNPPCSPKAV
jgi:hypothetical protein